MPPLRERKEDIPLLARHFLKEFSHTYNRRPKEIADDALDTLMRYTWPGNVRELRNLIERIVIMNPAVVRLERKHLPTLVYRDGGRRSLGEFSSLHEARASYERDYILKKLDENLGNVTPHCRSAGPGAQPHVSQDEGAGDCGEGVAISNCSN